MRKGQGRQRKEAQPPNPPAEDVSAISDSSEAEGMSNTDEIPAYRRSALRQTSPIQVELESEDSVTCQWDDCGVVFTHLPTLIEHIHNDHIGVHKSNYTCEWSSCLRRGLPQTSRFALISHIRSHTGEKPFICPLPECDKSFTRSDALAKHMRLQHNLTPPAPGRGGARKRKRGVEEGFNTFKVDPNATTEQHAGDEHGSETHIKQEHQASALTKGKGTSNGKGKKQNRQAQLQAQLQRTPSPDAAQQQPGAGEDEDGYVSSASDVLPPSLMANYDESTGLLMGKPRTKVMYLLMKAKHRYATEQHDILSGQLRNARAQLEHEKFEKESALNEVLYRMLGPEADELSPIRVPPEIVFDDLPPDTMQIDSRPMYDRPLTPLQNGSHA